MEEENIFVKHQPDSFPHNFSDGINGWAAILKLIGHPQRLSILYALCKKSRSVKDLQDLLQMPQSVLSQHLGLLRRATIVDRKKEGTLAIYSITQTRIKDLIETICVSSEFG